MRRRRVQVNIENTQPVTTEILSVTNQLLTNCEQTETSHFDKSQDPDQPTPQPLRIMICGTAGTGKSYLINALAQRLSNHCLITATTGIAAFSIHGCTIHSTLQLPIKQQSELQGRALQRLQITMKDKSYLIIDEMSMIGLKTLAWIDKRLDKTAIWWNQHYPDWKFCTASSCS